MAKHREKPVQEGQQTAGKERSPITFLVVGILLASLSIFFVAYPLIGQFGGAGEVLQFTIPSVLLAVGMTMEAFAVNYSKEGSAVRAISIGVISLSALGILFSVVIAFLHFAGLAGNW
jgi:flagellar basal body-associated protein FliL